MEFYSNIFDDFLETNNDTKEKESWKCKSIIELMKISKGRVNNIFCENGLRIIMDLSNYYYIFPHECESKSCVKLSKKEKLILISILKKEFI
ncbi:MAG: hypothetical protein ACTSUT_07630 [Promethearchaeota archaeon]